MTNPNDPFEDRSRHPENTGDDTPSSYPSYPSYPSTPHPEDTPGYAGYGAYGATGVDYGAYGAEQQAGWNATQPQGTGKVDPMAAVRWGFRAVFGNWKLWILGFLALIVLSMVVSMIGEWVTGGFDANAQPGVGNFLFQALFGLVSAAAMIFIYTGAIRQVDKPVIGLGDFTHDVNLGPALGLYLLIQLIMGGIVAAVVLPVMFADSDIANAQMASQDDVLAFLSVLFGLLAVMFFILVLVTPLTQLMVWYLIDRRTNFGGAVSEGFRAGLRNYGRLLLFNVVSGIVVLVAALVTFGLALIILSPALLLTQAMMYRQAAGGALPADSVR